MTKYRSFEEWLQHNHSSLSVFHEGANGVYKRDDYAKEAWSARDAEVEELKAKNEKLVEALKFYAESSRSVITSDFHSAKEAVNGSLQLVYTFGKRARETLKELGL